MNPAVTLAFASVKKFPWTKVPHYMVGQYAGGFLAALVAYINYNGTIAAHQAAKASATNQPIESINSTANASSIIPEPKPYGAIFATYPQDSVTVLNALIDQARTMPVRVRSYLI